ncbi:MAG: lytic transglycosylase domain-containing protein [Candidatus Nanopelagicales bacterium]
MSVIDVTSRISEIRAQFEVLRPQTSGGTAFAAALSQADAANLQSAARDAAALGTAGVTGSAAASAAGATTPSGSASGTSALPASTPFADLFQKAEAKYGVDATLLATVAKHESSFNPRAVSHAGAQGLMQLMPGTARGLGVADPFDPAQAIDGAARLLRDLEREFGRTDLALAAYNAGPGAVHKYNGIPPYPETQNYVRSIMADLGNR